MKKIHHETIDQIFEQFTHPGSPGCVVGVMQGGDLVYKKGYGLANLEYNIPITPSTCFPVASMAKQFTAMAVTLLADRGELALADDIRTYLPEIPDFGKPITIRHLIHHISGLRSDLMLLLAAGWRLEDVITNADVMSLVKQQRELNFPPGEKFSYCGTGYLLLAYIVEHVNGGSFAEFCRANIFEPLGMASTLFIEDYLQLIQDRAYAYYPAGENCYRNAVLTSSLVGGTGLFTTIEDLARWDRNFITGQVGGQAVIDQMHQRGVLNNGQPIDYAFGLIWDTYKGRKTVGHGGDGAGIHSYLMRFPEEALSVAVLANCSSISARRLALQVADLYLDQTMVEVLPGEAAPETIVLPPEQLAQRAGRYFDVENSAFVDIAYQDGSLQLWGYKLAPVGENSFIFAGAPEATAEFIPAGVDAPLQVKIDIGMGTAAYTWSEPVTPSLDDLQAFTGCYTSPELGVTWRITLDSHQLMIDRPRQGAIALVPVIADVFTNAWTDSILHSAGRPWVLVFDRDAQGEVSGFRTSDPGGTVRNLRFFRNISWP